MARTDTVHDESKQKWSEARLLNYNLVHARTHARTHAHTHTHTHKLMVRGQNRELSVLTQLSVETLVRCTHSPGVQVD